jgi:hypothetical protein
MGKGGAYRILRPNLASRIRHLFYSEELPLRHLCEWTILAENQETA